MKKYTLRSISSLVLVLVLSLSLTCNSLAASSLYRENIISELLADGLSQADAEYYADVDCMFREMEAAGEVLDLDLVTCDITDEEVLANQAAFRNRVLSKDPAAIKKALLMDANISGQNDIESLVQQHEGLKKYTIIYADGSSISCNADNSVTPYGLTSDTFASGWLDNYADYSHAIEYKLVSGASYSKNRLDVKYTYSSTGSTMTYAVGTQSSYGVVLLANSTGGGITRAEATSSNPAEARNSVIYQVSGSISLTSPTGLSIAFNAGATWTQDIYYRVYKSGYWCADAATYT